MNYNATSERDIKNKQGTPLGKCNDIGKLRKIAEALWQLLDDIDTGPDMFKPDDLCSYRQLCNYIQLRANRRHEHLTSDGYGLFVKL
jgi:hypothetical protein